jgi:hypothetical protein
MRWERGVPMISTVSPASELTWVSISDVPSTSGVAPGANLRPERSMTKCSTPDVPFMTILSVLVTDAKVSESRAQGAPDAPKA